MSLSVNVLFFGQLADLADSSIQLISLDTETTTADLYNLVRQTHPELPSLERDKSLKVAVNQRFSNWDTLLAPGDEVAFMPPVTGG